MELKKNSLLNQLINENETNEKAILLFSQIELLQKKIKSDNSINSYIENVKLLFKQNAFNSSNEAIDLMVKPIDYIHKNFIYFDSNQSPTLGSERYVRQKTLLEQLKIAIIQEKLNRLYSDYLVIIKLRNETLNKRRKNEKRIEPPHFGDDNFMYNVLIISIIVNIFLVKFFPDISFFGNGWWIVFNLYCLTFWGCFIHNLYLKYVNKGLSRELSGIAYQEEELIDKMHAIIKS